tara:strand:+ start:344 stop:1276 length:933 start_codon:yes stop_codon:yes gene_type:complete
MATWKKMVVEDSASHIAQTSALSDHMKGAAGSRSFTSTPEVLFQNATDTTDSLARGASATFLRMDTNGTALEWDTLAVAGDSGAGAVATSDGLRVLSENQNQILTVAANNSITIGFPDNVTIDGDLIVTGGKVTFGNGEIIDNETNGTVKVTADLTELSGDLQVTGNDIKSSTGASAMTLSGDDVTINGDLTVSGAQTIVNTEIIQLADNVIVLNSNHTGDASQDAGITVERGNQTDESLFWDESDTSENGGRWAIGSGESSNVFGTIHGYVSTVTSGTTVPGSTTYGSGPGSFQIDSNDGTGQVYIRMT